MQSTYSVISLGRNKSVTLMTTSSTLGSLEPVSTTISTTEDSASNSSRPKIVEKISKSILPLYPQFVYTIRVVSLGGQANKPDIIDSLNEHSQESSKIRFAMIRSLSNQIGLNQSELKLNWIDRMIIKPISSFSASSSPASASSTATTTPQPTTTNSDYMTSLYHTDSGDDPSYGGYGDYYHQSIAGGSSSEELDGEVFDETSSERVGVAEENQPTPPAPNRDQIVLVSFSSSRLYDLQRAFLDNLKQLSGYFNFTFQLLLLKYLRSSINNANTK